MVLFCPKWFEPCQKVEPEFEELARKWQRELLGLVSCGLVAPRLNTDSSITRLRFAQAQMCPFLCVGSRWIVPWIRSYAMSSR